MHGLKRPAVVGDSLELGVRLALLEAVLVGLLAGQAAVEPGLLQQAPRLLLGLAILLMVIEGRQEG